MASFEEMGIKRMFLKNLNLVAIRKPTPVQKNCIPPILKGKSVVACAATGSGKTTAFALPLLQLMEEPRGIFAVVIVPTRELAYQISTAITTIYPVNCCVVTGGRSRIHQSVELEARPQLIVATPGRLADHLRRGTDLRLSGVRVLVLDEVDRLLEDGFSEDLATVVESLPASRQTLMFSATCTPAVLQAIAAFPEPPFVWREGVSEAGSDKVGNTAPMLEDFKLQMPAQFKESFLVQLLKQYTEKNEHSLVIVFTNHCKWCHLIGIILRQFGITAVVLHSFLNQRRRLRSLSKFKSNQVRVMIATDVASRGLDIPMVDLVINENVPEKPKDYLHRVGRTARAGRKGLAITLVNQFEIDRLKAVEKRLERELPVFEDVKLDDVNALVKKVSLARRNAEMKLDNSGFGERRRIQREKEKMLNDMASGATTSSREKKTSASAAYDELFERDEEAPKKKRLKTT